MLALVAWFLLALPGPDATSCDERLADAITNLAFRLDAHVTHRLPNQNSAFSPLGVSGLLALFEPGSEGETKAEIQNVLQIQGLESLGAYKELYLDLEQDNENVTILEVANRIYTRFGLNLMENYQQDVFENFDADVTNLDFSGDPINSYKTINDWLGNRTRGYLNQLLDRPLPVDTFLFALNVVYFKAFWKIPFEVENTKIGKFYMRPNDGMNMMMMRHPEIILRVGIDHEKNFTLVELPYSDSRTAMLILLPDVGKSLDDVMNSINSSYFQGFLKRLVPFKLSLTLPRFKLQVGYELSSILQSLGVQKLFEPDHAELGAMFGSHGYHAQRILHSVSVDVTETGTEASGAGYVTVGLARSPTLDIRVNRPFTFLIYDKRAKCVVFMGRVVKPPSDEASLLLASQDGQDTDTGALHSSHFGLVMIIMLLLVF